jgi:hypothetical protein
MVESSLQKEISFTSPDAKPLATSIAESGASRKPKRFALGNSDFEMVVERGGQFVDKTLFIKEVVDDPSIAKVIIRPRQFGLTSNLLMLYYFLDRTVKGQDKLFQGLNIRSVDNGAYQEHQGKYTVIFLSLSYIKANTFEKALRQLEMVIQDLYREQLKEHGFKRTPVVDSFLKAKATETQLKWSLNRLTEILHAHYQKPVIILLDEYDTPLRTAYHETPSNQLDKEGDREAYNNSYYRKMCDFMDIFLGAALKTNPFLHTAVLTGFLPPSPKELPGFNNASIYSALNEGFSTCFGFTREEVQAQLQYAFGSEANEKLLKQVERHYGGYQIGEKAVFNPWAIVNFIEMNRERQAGKDFLFKDYWINSSSDQRIISGLLTKSDEATKVDIIALVNGKSVVKAITASVAFSDLRQDSSALWSYMVLRGYLTTVPSPAGETLDYSQYRLAIPNQQLYNFYNTLVKGWAEERAKEKPVLGRGEVLEDKRGPKVQERKVLESSSQSSSFSQTLQKVTEPSSGSLLSASTLVTTTTSSVPSVPFAEVKASQPSRGLPLEVSDFKDVVVGEYRFVDKTASIVKETMDDFSMAKVIIRPPQFGKTSYLSTLRYFLDSAVEGQKLFQGLSIWSVNDGAYRHYQGQYAVIFLSLKDIKATTFEGALKEFAGIVKHAYGECRQKYGFELAEEIDVIMRENATKIKLQFSLKILIETLYKHCKKNVVVLLDEYDTPLRTAYAHTSSDQLDSHESYYRQMCAFIDGFLGAALKDNSYLHRAVLTGSLRPAAGEFSGFNNASVYSMLDYGFKECFGFSRAEVQAQLQSAFGSEANEKLLDDVEEYYGGYRVADISLFDPWAITHFIADNRRHQAGKGFIFKTYVANVTSNDIFVKKLLEKADEASKRDIMTLVEGETITKVISGNITFASLEKNPDALWSFLLFNGYLTVSPVPKGETLGRSEYRLTIPNEKLWAFYSRLLEVWSKQEMEEQKPSSYPSHARFVGQPPPKVNEPLSSVSTVSSSQSSSLSTTNVTAHSETTVVNSGPPKAT